MIVSHLTINYDKTSSLPWLKDLWYGLETLKKFAIFSSVFYLSYILISFSWLVFFLSYCCPEDSVNLNFYDIFHIKENDRKYYR